MLKNIKIRLSDSPQAFANYQNTRKLNCPYKLKPLKSNSNLICLIELIRVLITSTWQDSPRAHSTHQVPDRSGNQQSQGAKKQRTRACIADTLRKAPNSFVITCFPRMPPRTVLFLDSFLRRKEVLILHYYYPDGFWWQHAERQKTRHISWPTACSHVIVCMYFAWIQILNLRKDSPWIPLSGQCICTSVWCLFTSDVPFKKEGKCSSQRSIKVGIYRPSKDACVDKNVAISFNPIFLFRCFL